MKIVAQSLDILGRLQLATGVAQKALATWEQANEIYKQVNDEGRKTQNFLNQAQAMQTLGQYLQAQKMLDKLQETLFSTSDPQLKVTQLRNLGNVFSPLASLWGETLIYRWLKRRKFVKFSKTDETGLDKKVVNPWLSTGTRAVSCLLVLLHDELEPPNEPPGSLRPGGGGGVFGAGGGFWLTRRLSCVSAEVG